MKYIFKLALIFTFLLPNNVLAQQIKPIPVMNIEYYETESKPGWEERGPEWIKWLSPSVRIGGGSGTICYYDSTENWAYVISCGHLFPGGRGTAEYYKKNPSYRTIDVFYHNDKKLPEFKSYKAEVLCYVRDNDWWDVSLMRFKPDWNDPWYLPIAPLDIKLEPGKYYHSLGCDGRSEVAHYLVKYVKDVKINNELTESVTQDNNPRGGRSGGGVFTDDGELIMICSRGGGGYGYWTSVNQIHKFLKEEGFGWLLEAELARSIPIKNKDGSKNDYPKDFIPIPRRGH